MIAIGVVAVFALVIVVIVWFLKRSYAKYAELWGRLAPLVGGTSKGSKMTGTFEGRPLRARVNSVGGGENSETTYYFEVVLESPPRGADWRITYGGEKLFGFGEKRWHISTKDEGLKQRLEQAGVLVEVAHWGNYPQLEYKAKRGTLEYKAQVSGMFSIPDRPEFEAQLGLLSRLARINEQVNGA
ncbi:MAG TPA: hypothetical protein VGV59_01575 [Pyrinomonadaceae bacterium]|nr:hypothetical protein [Pyrinomonadaceae bacterium]